MLQSKNSDGTVPNRSDTVKNLMPSDLNSIAANVYTGDENEF